MIDELDSFGEKVLNQEVEQIPWEKKYSAGNGNPETFRQFDMASDCSDHHFLSSSKEKSFSQVRNCCKFLLRAVLWQR